MFAIVGSGEYLPPMQAVDRELLALLGPAPRVVCVPTAAGTEGDIMIDSWMRRGVEHFAALGAESYGSRIWDNATANDPDLAALISSADLVYLSGGRPNHLHSALQSSLAWKAVLEVTDRGGLLVGCSAGAMIQGELFVGRTGRHDGFGLWPDVVVIPHFDEIPTAIAAAMRKAAGKSRVVVGVNGNTALIDIDGTYRVVGDEITIWSSADKHTFGPGDVPAELLRP